MPQCLEHIPGVVFYILKILLMMLIDVDVIDLVFEWELIKNTEIQILKTDIIMLSHN